MDGVNQELQSIPREMLPCSAQRKPTMDLRSDLRAGLSKAGLGSISAELEKLSRDCIRMRSTPCPDTTISVGESKLGGLPDLPSGLTWPDWETGYLTFVAQVNLSELPASDLLPNLGVLSFFYDREQSAWGFDLRSL